MINRNTICILFYFVFSFIACQSQEKQVDKDVMEYFDFENEYCFDHDNKEPFQSYLVDSIGQFTIHYYPQFSELINYYLNFEENNNFVNSVYSEVDDNFCYSDSDRTKIDELLKNKINDNLQDYTIIGSYIPIKYINKDSDGVYRLLFPYTRNLYKLDLST